ncbi:hypothetical protein [Comamonas kerstersii]|uniref:hypothetical protein n=1 Tax=Comamonas kerstersii TaxID=225992 RepID=UPI001B32B539|nr:hypothetical protein [Comamonas kerstersii]QTW18187.1 hypothetical protein H8N02_13505 [Comamonas kerstersii]
MSDAPGTPVRRTAFARAVKAVEQQLQSACVSPHIFRNRSRVVPKDMPTAVVVRSGQAEGETPAGMGSSSQWQLVLAVECYARARVGVDVEDALDDVLVAVSDALTADRTLGGVVADVAPVGVHWEFDVDGEKTACATVTYIVQQFSAAASLT